MANDDLKNVRYGISKSLKHRIAAWIAKTDKYSLFSLALISGDILTLKSPPQDDLSKFLPIGFTIIVILNTLILVFTKAPRVYEAWHTMWLELDVIHHQAAEKHESEVKRHEIAMRQTGIEALIEGYYQAILAADERYAHDLVAHEIVKALALKELQLLMWKHYYLDLEVKGDKIHIKFE